MTQKTLWEYRDPDLSGRKPLISNGTTIREPAYKVLPDMLGKPPAVNSGFSIEAADTFEPQMNRKERAVYEWIATAGHSGVTDADIIWHFTGQGWSMNTPRARRVALRDKALIEACGTRKVGKYKQTLWKAV